MSEMIGFLALALVIIFGGLCCIGGLALLWDRHDKRINKRTYKRMVRDWKIKQEQNDCRGV